jgi:hypothetical protein
MLGSPQVVMLVLDRVSGRHSVASADSLPDAGIAAVAAHCRLVAIL